MRGGIDRGWCLSYWRLSYRRKFIRSLWTWLLVLAIIAASTVMNENDARPMIVGTLAVIGILQIGYNWLRWSRESVSPPSP